MIHPPPYLCPKCTLEWTRDPLTARQLDLLRWIAQYIETAGYAPTLAIIADRLDARSLATAHEYLSRLQAKGYLVREAGRARSIRLVEPIP